MSNTSRWSLSRLFSNQDQQPSGSTSPTSATMPYDNQSRASTQAQTQSRIPRQSTSHAQAHLSSTARQSQSTSSHSRNGSRATGSSRTATRRWNRPSQQDDPYAVTPHSTPVVPDSLWFAEDFMIGAGMVIIQPSTGKIALLYEGFKDERGRQHHRWFLPKGRKDIGESLEETALREAYEEVRATLRLRGYRDPLPISRSTTRKGRVLVCTCCWQCVPRQGRAHCSLRHGASTLLWEVSYGHASNSTPYNTYRSSQTEQ